MTNTTANKRHEIEMTLYDNVTIGQIKEIMTYGNAPQIDLDLENEIYITIDFDNLDDFVAFFNKYAKCIRTVWDTITTGVKFHNYV